MDNHTAIIFFLLGLLQVIGLGLTSWALLKLIEVLERLGKLEGKFDSFPIQQISNNRHRIENLERHQDRVDERLSTVERVLDTIKTFCNKKHEGNL